MGKKLRGKSKESVTSQAFSREELKVLRERASLEWADPVVTRAYEDLHKAIDYLDLVLAREEQNDG